ncbi:universal stress protein [Flagellimonas aquimarina]|uniref:Universal stress protein n=1 Tax=Flagellimonas aquimarina TaxID=2201895 RepID=A0A316KTY0_9FLAO|nr:universal stress protein [Allomuricauda koreensis]PWL37652.1 universal stress protein [Allomuricauda koreensis]
MRQILLPTDFSKNAWNALFTAIKLYANFECTFYLMHSYEPKSQNIAGFKSSTRAGEVYQSLSDQSEKELEEIITYLETNHKNKNHTFKTISTNENLVTAIKELIPKHDIDAVLMGTKGATGAKEVFMGSNTVKVLKAVKNCTLIAVPEEFDFQSLDVIVFPTEYAHFFAKGVLQPFLELMGVWKSEVKIFHVAQEFKLNETQRYNREILKKRLEGYPYSFFKVTIKSTVSKAIRDFSKEQMGDLIVLTNYSHTFLERLTQEPVIKKVGFKTSIPLMVLPDFDG